MRFLMGIVAIAFFVPVLVHAGNISVSPIVIDKDIQPRDIIREQITIKNISRAKQNVYTFVNNVSLGADGKIEEFLDYQSSEKTASLANWIEISRGVIELMPGEEREIEFILRVHFDAKPGKYHALISFGTGTNRELAEQGLDRDSSVMVVGTVEKKVVELLQVKKFNAGNVFFSENTAEFTYTLKNNGDESVAPTGEIVIYDRHGKEIGAVSINGPGYEVPPGEEKEFTASWEGEYRLGRHKAYLSAVYGTVNRNNLTDTTYFFMLPWKQLLLFFVVGMSMLVYSVHVFHNRFFRRRRTEYVRTRRPVTPAHPATEIMNLKHYDQ